MVTTLTFIWSCSLCLGVFLLPGRNYPPPFDDTLSEVLQKAGLPSKTLAGLSSRDLARPITSYIVTETGARALAFYFADDMKDNYLPEDFWLALSKGDVTRAARITISDSGLNRSLGSLLRIHFTRDFIVVGGHWSPSRAPSLVIRLKDLKAVTFFDGWVLQTLRDNRLVYHSSMVHFAPTHPARIRMRDLATGQDDEIYPLKPETELWKKRVEHVNNLYKKWGERLGNHHMDPSRFNLSFKDSRYDSQTDTLVLVMNFADPESNGLKYEDGLQDVAVLYRNVTRKPIAEEGPLEKTLDAYRVKSLDELARSRR